MTNDPAAPAVTEIPFSRPEYDQAEARAVAEVLASGWVSQGPRVAEFERRLLAPPTVLRRHRARPRCTWR
jgi:dTDP-4-amino-4,6-dideoxygalactose transaminase